MISRLFILIFGFSPVLFSYPNSMDCLSFFAGIDVPILDPEVPIETEEPEFLPYEDWEPEGEPNRDADEPMLDPFPEESPDEKPFDPEEEPLLVPDAEPDQPESHPEPLPNEIPGIAPPIEPQQDEEKIEDNPQSQPIPEEMPQVEPVRFLPSRPGGMKLPIQTPLRELPLYERTRSPVPYYVPLYAPFVCPPCPPGNGFW